MELASSDAAAILFFLYKEKEKNGDAKSGPMSTRRGQAASVTLLRREQLRSASAPTGCGANRKHGRALVARLLFYIEYYI